MQQIHNRLLRNQRRRRQRSRSRKKTKRIMRLKSRLKLLIRPQKMLKSKMLLMPLIPKIPKPPRMLLMTHRPKMMTANLSCRKSKRKFNKQLRTSRVAALPSPQIRLQNCNPKRTKIRCRPSILSRKCSVSRINSLRRVRSLLRTLSRRLKACLSLC